MAMETGLGVYDFKEEDELVDVAAGKYLEKFKNPNSQDSPGRKYQCLRNFSQETATRRTEIGRVSCLDVDLDDSDRSCDGPDHLGAKESPGSDSEKSDQDEPAMMSADDESFGDQSKSSSSSDRALYRDTPNGLLSSNHFDHIEMEDNETMVFMSPDYVMFRNNHFTTALVIFSTNGIHVKETATDHVQEDFFSFDWGLEDIIKIEYKWSQRVGVAIIKVYGLVKDVVEAEGSQGASVVEEMRFAVIESNWPEKQLKINALDVKYSAVWNALVDGEEEGDLRSLYQSRHYFPVFDDRFEDVVYPKGDPDAVSISKRDVDLLQPETFINDTIIDFYIKYLKNQITPEERHRFHFFNSFFFRKLADLDKDPSSIVDGKAAFLRVRKWTRKLDIFGKDYVFIPVNFNLHWSLIVICHPGEVAHSKDEDMDKASKVPCILHMDSIRGSHAGLKNLIQSYLCEEWKERNKGTSEMVSSKFLNLRFVSLELPQQENSFDCGLFLLHYLELFLSEAPVHFSPFKITDLNSFLNADWFPPAEASLKRTLIQNLIFELLKKHSPEIDCDVNGSYRSTVRNGNENSGADDLSQRLGLPSTSHSNVAASQDTRGIEMTLLETSSMRNSNGTKSSMAVREFFDSGTSSGVLFERLQNPFENSSSFYPLNTDMSPRQQVGLEVSDQVVCMTTGESNFRQMSVISAPVGLSPRDFGAEMPWNLGISGQDGDAIESQSDIATADSDESEEVGIIDNLPVQGFCSDYENSELPNPRAAKMTLMKDVEISKNQASCDSEAQDSNENEEHPFHKECSVVSLDQGTSGEELTLPLHSERVKNKSEVSQTTDRYTIELQEQRCAKRQRLILPVKDGTDDVGILAEDQHL